MRSLYKLVSIAAYAHTGNIPRLKNRKVLLILSLILDLLGHETPNATEIYTHVTHLQGFQSNYKSLE